MVEIVISDNSYKTQLYFRLLYKMKHVGIDPINFSSYIYTPKDGFSRGYYSHMRVIRVY